MRSFYFFALFFLLFTSPLFSQPQWVNYVNDYLINDIALEGDYIWVGSQGGLSKINKITGEQQDFLPTNSGLKGFGVATILVAPDGTKWLGGETGGLMRFDGTNWQDFYYINTGDTLISVSKMELEPNGDLWLKSSVNGNCSGCSKVFRYDGSIFTKMDEIFGQTNPNTGSGAISDFDIAPNGDIWILSNSFVQSSFVTTIQKFVGNNVVEVYDVNEIGLSTNEYISNIAVGPNGDIFCTINFNTQNVNKFSIRKFDGSSWSLVPIQGADATNGYASTISTSPTGDLWVACYPTTGNFFLHYDGQNWEKYTVDALNGIPPGYNGGTLLEIDDQNHWWLSYFSFAGVHAPRLFEINQNNVVNSYDTEMYPLPNNYVDDVTFDCNNKVWFSGSDMFAWFDGAEWGDYTIDDMGIPADYFSIWSTNLDTATCDLWLAFYENNQEPTGFSKFDGTSFTNYSTPSGYDVFKVLVDTEGKVWVASASDGLGRLEGTTWTWFGSNNSPLSNFIVDIIIDDQNRVWISDYSNGVFIFDGTSWTNFNSNNSPLVSYYFKFFKDNDGNIWINNSISKPIRFDGASWIIFPGQLQSNFDVLAQDYNGDYWLSGNYAIYKFDGNTFTKYDILNSPLGKNGARNIKIDPYGNKWFLHGLGVTVFNENGISNRLINPPSSVTGTVYFDTDQDGSHAPTGEPGIPGQPLTLQPDNITTYSTYGGFYKLHPQPGNHQITMQPDAPYVPTTATTLDLLMGSGDQSGFDFGAWTANPPDSIGMELTTGLARCSATTNVWIQVTNFGLFDVAGTVTLNFDPLVGFVSADPAPTSINGYSLTWDFTGLGPYAYDPIKVVFQNPNADFVGEWLDFNATATLSGSGQNTSDVAAIEVRCSFDPNEKQAAPTGESVAQYSLLGDALDYTVFFQNKGNDTAFIVVIRDTLDSDLDAASFQLLASSHPVRVERQGSVLTFFFENINLPWEAADEPGSHGFVKYRIRPNTGLPDPTDIQNTAHIYFDFNPAIVTNTTANTLVETLPFLATDDSVEKPSINVYPNPNNGSFTMEVNGDGPWTATVSDVAGRQVKAVEAVGKAANFEGLRTGFYFVTIWQNGKVATQKIVVGQ